MYIYSEFDVLLFFFISSLWLQNMTPPPLRHAFLYHSVLVSCKCIVRFNYLALFCVVPRCGKGLETKARCHQAVTGSNSALRGVMKRTLLEATQHVSMRAQRRSKMYHTPLSFLSAGSCCWKSQELIAEAPASLAAVDHESASSADVAIRELSRRV